MKNIFIFFLITVIAACSSGNSTDKKTELANLKKEAAKLQDKIIALEKELSPSDSANAATEIAITEMKPASFRHYIEVQAKIDADENVTISPEMPGVVTIVHAEPGDKVSKGTVLAELDAETVRKQLDEVQLQADFLKTVYEKQKALWDQKVGSEMQYIKAKNDYEGIKRRAATLQEQFSMSRITSPINGVVDAVNIKIGETVSPATRAFRVVNLSGLKVKAEVAEAYVSKVNKNDEVLVDLPDINKQISTTLTYSGQVIDPLNRTFNVEADLKNEKDLHPNMVAVLKIVDYANDSAFTVPVNVIQHGTEGTYLYVAAREGNKNVAKKKLVRTGQAYNGFVEVVAGLKQGDKVITTGYQDLLEGEVIKF